MKDDAFADRIKDLFEQEKTHPYEPEEWRRLSRRLNEGEVRPLPWWQRWLPLGLAAVILLLGWQLWQQRTLSDRVADLTEQLENKQATGSQSVTETQQRTTIIYDTIYRTTVVETSVEKRADLASAYAPLPRPLSNRFAGEGGRLSSLPLVLPGNLRSLSAEHLLTENAAFPPYRTGFGIIPPGDFRSAGEDYRQYVAAAAAAANTAGQAGRSPAATANQGTYFITDYLPVDGLRKFRIPHPAFPDLPAPAAAPLPGPSLWLRLKPKNYALTLSAGSFHGLPYGNDDGNAMGSAALELFPGKRISLEIGANWLPRTFRFDPENHTPPTDLPILPPTNQYDQLETVRGNLHLLQLPVGLRYYPLRGDRLRAFAGAGIVPILSLPSSLRYTYEDDDDNYYDLVNNQVMPAGLRLGAIYGTLGVQYGLGRHWQLEASGTLQRGVGTFDYAYQRPELGRWQVGVGFAFQGD